MKKLTIIRHKFLSFLSNLALFLNGHLACKGFLHELHMSCSRNKLKGTSAPQSSRNCLGRKRSLSKTHRRFLFSCVCKEGLLLGLQGSGTFKDESQHNHKQGSLVCNSLCDLLSTVSFSIKAEEIIMCLHFTEVPN